MTRPYFPHTAITPHRLLATETNGTAKSTIQFFQSCLNIPPQGNPRTSDNWQRLGSLPIMWPAALKFSGSYTLADMITVLEGALNILEFLQNSQALNQRKTDSYGFDRHALLTGAKNILTSDHKGLRPYCGMVNRMLSSHSPAPSELATLSKQLLRLSKLGLQPQHVDYPTLISTLSNCLNQLAALREGGQRQKIMRRIEQLQETLTRTPERPLTQEKASAPNDAPAQI